MNGRWGPLKYGNTIQENVFSDTQQDDIAQNNLVFHSKYKNSTTVKNLIDDLILTGNNNMDFSDIDGNENNTCVLYKKYTEKNLSHASQYGHYFDNNKLIIVSYGQVPSGIFEVQIVIVSFGQILHLKDIKEVIKFIISNGEAKPSVRNIAVKQKNTMTAYKYSANQWVGYHLDRRSFDTIFIKDETIIELRKEMESFFRIEQLYRDCDVPYRKGILFYGPPGTGKTSLVKALAYEYQIPVYMININDSNINDDTIVDMLNSIGGNTNKILLFEDIDSAFSEKEKVKFEEKKDICNFELNDDKINRTSNKKYLTYAGLLNALDGVLSNHHGVITIMTTNYIEKLGDALIRPGRIDHKYILGPCDKKQIMQMTESIVSKSIDMMQIKEQERKEQDLPPLWKIRDNDFIQANIEKFADNLVDQDEQSKVNPCKLQQYILKNIEDTENVFKNYQELLK